MAVPMTPTQFVAQANKWGLKLDTTRHPDWAKHNRDMVRAFGPVHGVVIHHTGSTTQLGMVDYCYRGDAERNLPGPLALGVVTDDGVLHMVGWGRCNTQGPGDGAVLTAMAAGKVPTFPPGPDNADGNSSFYGWEFCSAGQYDPFTPKQFETAVLLACAILDFHAWRNVPASVIGHFQWTRRKPGDPAYTPGGDDRAESLDWPKYIAAIQQRLAAPKPPEDDMPLTDADIVKIRAAVQAELEEYGARLWGATGTAGTFVARTDARETDIQGTVHHIDDGGN